MPQRYGRIRTANTCAYLREGPLSGRLPKYAASLMESCSAGLTGARGRGRGAAGTWCGREPVLLAADGLCASGIAGRLG